MSQLKRKILMIDIVFFSWLLLNSFYMPLAYALPDEATWQKEIHADYMWLALFKTGNIWNDLRFYGYGDEQFTIKIWRKSNASDALGLYFDQGILRFWDKRNETWLTVGSYPENQWLETSIDVGSYATFYLRDARTDVNLLEQSDLFGHPEWYDHCYELSFCRRGKGLKDIFEYEISLTNGSVAFDYTEFCRCPEIFYWPIKRDVIEDFDNDDFSNWDSSTITCNSAYEVIGVNETMTIGKYWISGDEPSNPEVEDVERPWWENWQAQLWAKFTDMWEGIKATLSDLPLVGDFLSELWVWLEWGWSLISSLWNMVISNIPILAMVIVLSYFFGFLYAIPSGNVTSIKDAIISPVNLLIKLLSLAGQTIQAIWNFIKFW